MLTIHGAAHTWDRAVDRYIALTEFSRGKFIQGGLPAERIVRSPYRDAFFFTWSAIDIAAIVAVVALDGGVKSPATFGFFLPELQHRFT